MLLKTIVFLRRSALSMTVMTWLRRCYVAKFIHCSACGQADSTGLRSAKRNTTRLHSCKETGGRLSLATFVYAKPSGLHQYCCFYQGCINQSSLCQGKKESKFLQRVNMNYIKTSDNVIGQKFLYKKICGMIFDLTEFRKLCKSDSFNCRIFTHFAVIRILSFPPPPPLWIRSLLCFHFYTFLTLPKVQTGVQILAFDC